MIPKYIPVFRPKDILISNTEYEDDNSKTVIGWLKELFLYHYVDDDSFEIRPEDRKDFNDVISTFLKECKISIKTDMHEWEEDPTNTRKKQAKALNMLREKLGYTTIFYI